MRFLLALVLATLSLPAPAQEGTPPLPRERPEAAAPAEPAASEAPVVPEGQVVPLPRTRPEAEAPKPSTVPAVPPPAISEPAVPPPTARVSEPTAPPRIYQTACPAVLLGQVEAEAQPPIAENQCGTQSPLSVTGVLANGRMVPVAGDVVTDCGMASAMPAWIASIDSYLMAKEETRIAEVIVGTSYMCRNVNGADGGNLSFHAFADALDVVGFKLEDGRTVTVEGGWADALSPEGRLLRFAHDSACAHFTTTLGPEANALHRDHLHVDLGCHGKTCTSRLCE